MSSDPLVEDTLAIIVEALDHLRPSSKTRELRAKAESFRRALERWGSSSPTAEQRAALREVVVDLHADTMALEKREKAEAEAPTRSAAMPSGFRETSKGAEAARAEKPRTAASPLKRR